MKPVLVAGAGPVGLSAAAVLHAAGLPVVVLEAEPRLPENLRASTFQPPTLDMLSGLGADRKLVEMGRIAPRVQYRDRAGWVAEFDLGLLAGETAHPYRVQCEQYKLNQVLAAQLPALRFSSEVSDVQQDADGVSVTLADGGRLAGSWLIGADGAASRVRKALGIRLEGFTWPERFLVASTSFDFASVFPNLCDVSYFADPEEWFFLLRVGDVWRAMFPTRPEEKDEEVLSDASIEARLQRVYRRPGTYPVTHRTLYPVHQRVAERYRKGRVFLAGDAAHLNNPLGGMGMNGGIHDAFNLAKLLADVLKGNAPVSAIDAYERQRRPIALEYVNTISAANKHNLETRDPAEQRRWREEMRRAASDPERARDYLRRISMIASLKKAAALLFLLAILPAVVLAQTFPSRQITFVVPYPPGATADLLPRAIAPLMTQSMGVPVVVENRPGAAGNVGAAFVAKGDASGHTLLMAPAVILATSRWLYRELPYDPRKDLVPVINAAITPNMWVAHPGIGVDTMQQLIALAKSKPGALGFASGGAGSTAHLCGELLKTSAGIDLLHVTYKGPAAAHQDLLAGRVPFMCDNFSNVISHVRAGRLRALAVTALARNAQAPDVPTVHESALPGFEMNNWYGVAAPAATPGPVVQKLNAEIARALRSRALTERLDSLGLTVVADSPEEFARFVAAESEKMRKLVTLVGARVE